MSLPSKPFDIARLRDLFAYDPATGVITNRLDRRCARAGAEAGGIHQASGYRIVVVDGQALKAHRIAWALVHGEWPKFNVDHRNGVRNDNRLSNLRDADDATNMQNQRRPHADSSVGVLGVVRSRNRYRAKLKANGRYVSVGTFDTPELAHAAYLSAKRRLHAGCSI